MLARVLLCAIAIGMAAPAYAGEKTRLPESPERTLAAADAIPLLMQDERATWGTPALPAESSLLMDDAQAVWGSPMHLSQLAPGFNMTRPITLTAVPQLHGDLASFDALGAPAESFGYLTESPDRIQALTLVPATYTLNPGMLTPRYRAEPMGGAMGALSVFPAPSPYRPRRSLLDTRLVLRIDGEESSPPLTFGGGVASVLNVLPRQ